MTGVSGGLFRSISNIRNNSFLFHTALTTSLLAFSMTAARAEINNAPDEVTLSELSVTGNGPAVERAGGPVIGYRCSANHSILYSSG